MSGAEAMREIVNGACRRYEETIRAPREAWVTKPAYDALMEHVKSRLPVDIHEACGDYDRPSSPWYGSRPGDNGFTALKIATPVGYVNVRVLTDESVILA